MRSLWDLCRLFAIAFGSLSILAGLAGHNGWERSLLTAVFLLLALDELETWT